MSKEKDKGKLKSVRLAKAERLPESIRKKHNLPDKGLVAIETREYPDKKDKEIFKKAIAKWGMHKQLMMAVEEMSELTKEIAKLFRYDYPLPDTSLLEEVVDVELMIEQIKYIFNDLFDFEDHRKLKLSRLEGILDE